MAQAMNSIVSLHPRIRDVAVEKLNERIAFETGYLVVGNAEDFADYKFRIGLIAGLNQAIIEIDEACKLVMS